MKLRILTGVKLITVFLLLSNFSLLAQAPVATNATNIIQTSFTANWTPNSAVPRYYLLVATDAGFTNIVSGYNNLNVGIVTTYNVTSGLSANTLYYYKIGVDAMVAPIVYSNTITLRTGPANPTASAATNISQTGFQANWSSVPNGTNYKIIYSMNSNFTSPTEINAGNTTFISVSSLSPAAQYWYKIKAENDYGGVSGFSNVISLTTLQYPPDAPAAIEATAIGQTGFIANWNAAAAAEGYYLDVSTNNSFTNILSSFNNVSTGNVQSYYVSGLNTGTNYYYRLRSYNSGGTSSNSNIISLATLPATPAAPVAVSAVNITQTGFAAMWNLVTGADGYYLEIATDQHFTQFVSGYQNLNVGNNNAWGATGLTANTQYFYRVRAYNSGGTSGYSNVISLSTLPNAPTGPVAIAATNITQTSFTANWNPLTGAASFVLDISGDNLFQNFVPNFNNRNVGNVTSFQVSGLTANTPYYYRVRAVNTGGTSANSNIVSLITLPDVPLAPIAGPATILSNTSFSANWSTSSGAAGYYLDIALDDGFSNFLSGYNNKDAGNTASFTVTGISFNTNYYYRVRAYNNGGTSSSSNSVHVYILVGIENNLIPDNYFLYQNYPNPFNPSTIIKFSLKKTSAVKIILYDVAGREVELIANQEFQKGINIIRFNASSLSNGIYFYRIITNEFSDIKKMILLK